MVAMTDLYEKDTYTWAMQQADALRRRSANEIDWENGRGDRERGQIRSAGPSRRRASSAPSGSWLIRTPKAPMMRGMHFTLKLYGAPMHGSTARWVIQEMDLEATNDSEAVACSEIHSVGADNAVLERNGSPVWFKKPWNETGG